MKGGIKLHKKNGLNPTLTVCRWCGQDMGDIALLGAHDRQRLSVPSVPSDDESRYYVDRSQAGTEGGPTWCQQCGMNSDCRAKT